MSFLSKGIRHFLAGTHFRKPQMGGGPNDFRDDVISQTGFFNLGTWDNKKPTFTIAVMKLDSAES